MGIKNDKMCIKNDRMCIKNGYTKCILVSKMVIWVLRKVINEF